eukprot:4525601-Pleurochrysis_carterae.AAC.1
MLATTTGEPPAVSEVHCVPATWTTPSSAAAREVWSDARLGGKSGGLWATDGDLKALVLATADSAAPDETLTLAKNKFRLEELTSLDEIQPDGMKM